MFSKRFRKAAAFAAGMDFSCGVDSAVSTDGDWCGQSLAIHRFAKTEYRDQSVRVAIGSQLLLEPDIL